jgi:flagellar protein FlbD
MIKITHLKEGSTMLVNVDFIATVEETPDTLIHLQNGRKCFASESLEEIYDRIIEYRKQCNRYNFEKTIRETPQGTTANTTP